MTVNEAMHFYAEQNVTFEFMMLDGKAHFRATRKSPDGVLIRGKCATDSEAMPLADQFCLLARGLMLSLSRESSLFGFINQTMGNISSDQSHVQRLRDFIRPALEKASRDFAAACEVLAESLQVRSPDERADGNDSADAPHIQEA